MAKANLEVIDALRQAAERIESKSNYNWKDIGACNCGNLVQVVCNFDKKEIRKAGIKKHGDWETLVQLYRKDSPFEIDKIITKMVEFGFAPEDLVELENLSSPKIRSRIGKRFLKRDDREDAILYLQAWADILEEEMVESVKLTELEALNVYSGVKEEIV
ncbi:MAG TPA: hypothetical protein VIK89_14535 [Cytophagaceae bacterium]